MFRKMRRIKQQISREECMEILGREILLERQRGKG